jgi:hypothetical protein
MWRTVDNALSAHPRTANVACHPVDNACGQMCTNFHVTAEIESICTPELVTLFERFFCPNSDENSESLSNRNALQSRVRDLSRTPIFPHEMWTRC